MNGLSKITWVKAKYHMGQSQLKAHDIGRCTHIKRRVEVTPEVELFQYI